MSETDGGFRLVRSVPYRRRIGGADGDRYTVGINDLHEDRVDVSVLPPGGVPIRQRLVPGDVLTVGDQRFRLTEIVPGDRGSARFVEVGP
jgi:hypothetical protein